MNPKSQRGVALVITLIMLALITVITVVFLATARRDRSSTIQYGSSTDAELAAEAALRRSIADMVSQIQARGDMTGYELTVSRNYDLVKDPRVPVLVMTRYGTNESRHYLDLNRNGKFDQSSAGTPGDLEWIGLLDKLDRPHGADNKFIARYCYIVLPAGKALDVNYVHNDSSANQTQFGFARNQGVGPWELNLAGLLTDLDPLTWSYSYGNTPSLTASPTSGTAFEDAKSLIIFRNPTKTFRNLFGTAGANAFVSDNIDGGARAVNLAGSSSLTTDSDNPDLVWPGAESARHYFTPSDFFNTNKTSIGFVNRLNSAINNDPSAFYRMLAMLTTDSAPVKNNQINLNYENSSGFSETNFIPWDASPAVAPLVAGTAAAQGSVRFFTNAAARLFAFQSNDFNLASSTILQIQVAPSNEYSAAIHRIFQESANIYDATRSDRFPSVFRPFFTNIAGKVFLTGFTNDNNASYLSISNFVAGNPYGVPMVVGAKKGFPNLNEISMNQYIQISRKLQITRTATNAPATATNQMYIMGISNLLAVENWNSYSTAYKQPLDLQISVVSTVSLTNQLGMRQTSVLPFWLNTSVPANTWAGGQFRLPMFEQQMLLTNSTYRFSSNTFVTVGVDRFETNIGYPLPYWVLSVSNRMFYTMSEGGKIVDFVLLDQLSAVTDVSKELTVGNPYPGGTQNAAIRGVWSTNRVGGTSINFPTDGIRKQMDISLGNTVTSDADWNSYNQQPASGNDKKKSIDNLRRFVNPLLGSLYGNTGQTLASDTKLETQAGFSPIAKLIKTTTWQANDPLVHYQLPDLYSLTPSNSMVQILVPPNTPAPVNSSLTTLGAMNTRYAPWGGNPQLNDPFSPVDPTAYKGTIKDPGVRNSEDWDFPSSKFASIGQLGRVHRGTPWQTIYLKPDVASSFDWASQGLDMREHPTNDWRVLDLFTTAISDQTTRGLLSINQTNFAAWSALFAGVVVLTNAQPDDALGLISTNSSLILDPLFIQPSGAYAPANPPALALIVNAINRARDSRPTKTFTNLSELIQIPELTTLSPFLNQSTPKQLAFALNDAAYERIPQQILSLLKVGDARFVIYSYGQALKPKYINPVSKLAENYQITAEVATRTVVRLEGTPDRPRAVIESFNILPPD